jgi:hypothetical protein
LPLRAGSKRKLSRRKRKLDALEKPDIRVGTIAGVETLSVIA